MRKKVFATLRMSEIVSRKKDREREKERKK
jgi:hypothetical protein